MALVARQNGDSATTEFVQHASDDTLERYAVKTLTEPEAGPLVQHPVVFQSCRERLDMLRSRDRRPNLSSGNLLQIESFDDGCPPGSYPHTERLLRRRRCNPSIPEGVAQALRVRLRPSQSKVEAFKIVVGNCGSDGRKDPLKVLRSPVVL